MRLRKNPQFQWAEPPNLKKKFKCILVRLHLPNLKCFLSMIKLMVSYQMTKPTVTDVVPKRKTVLSY